MGIIAVFGNKIIPFSTGSTYDGIIVEGPVFVFASSHGLENRRRKFFDLYQRFGTDPGPVVGKISFHFFIIHFEFSFIGVIAGYIVPVGYFLARIFFAESSRNCGWYFLIALRQAALHG